MGEIIENIRTFATPIDDYTYTFGMQFKYDTWNRVKSIVYPDGEQVDYLYNSGGGLKSVVSNYGGNSYTYISDIQYNDFEQKTYLEYGNGAYSNYTYDILQRLSTLTSVSNQGTMQSISYVYDNVSNIDSVSNTAMPLSNGLGAQYFQKHNYDNLYRLTSSSGKWIVSNGFSGIYNLDLNYFDDGRIKSKTQYAEQLYTNTLGAINCSNNYYYSQNQAHTLDFVEDQITNTTSNFRYDANGNLEYQTNPSYEERFLCWDEENRLMGVTDKHFTSHYVYDHSGERTYKLTGFNESMNINGSWYNITHLKDETLFTSPYLVATPQGYTKHYYSGSERIASSIGVGGLEIIDQPLTLENDISWEHKKEVMYNHMYETVEQCLQRGFDIKENGLFVLHSLNRYNNDTVSLYFYHPDHLGSTSWITDRNGDAIQYLHYLPLKSFAFFPPWRSVKEINFLYAHCLRRFGEEWIDQRSTSWNAQYSFTGKIKDAETGYNYFGARYYDSGLSVWLSVDPLSDKYPSMSPYTYCANNPVMLVDPDGRLIIDPAFKKICPVFYNFMKTKFHDFVMNNEAILKPLMHFSGMTKEQVDYAVTDGQGPNLMISQSETPFEEEAAAYSYAPRGGIISITKKQADYLRKAKSPSVSKFDKQVAMLFTIQTILHELVHYGRQQEGAGEEKANLPQYYDVIDGIKYYRNSDGQDIGHLFESALFYNSNWKLNCKTYSDAIEIVSRLKGTSEENKLPTWP